MPSYRATALVLRKTKLGETDLIVTLLASDGRQLRAVAKGARKPGSRLCARFEPGCVCDLLLHKGRNLDVVTEAASLDAHAGVREDYDKLMAASVVLDFVEKVSLEGQTEERTFPLALATLCAMEEAPAAAASLVAVAFLLKAMAIHGYRVQVGECSVCGSPAREGLFSPEAGGVLCGACGSSGSPARVSQEGRELVRKLMGARMAELSELTVSREALSEVTGLTRSFVGWHLPARMRSLEFLG